MPSFHRVQSRRFLYSSISIVCQLTDCELPLFAFWILTMLSTRPSRVYLIVLKKSSLIMLLLNSFKSQIFDAYYLLNPSRVKVNARWPFFLFFFLYFIYTNNIKGGLKSLVAVLWYERCECHALAGSDYSHRDHDI